MPENMQNMGKLDSISFSRSSLDLVTYFFNTGIYSFCSPQKIQELLKLKIPI